MCDSIFNNLALWVVVSGTVGVIGSLSKSTNAVFLYFIMLILCQVMTVANIAINYHVITDNFEVGFHLTYLLSITSDSQNSMSIDIYSRHHVYMALSVVHIIFLCFFVVIAHSLLGVYEAGGTGYEMLCAEDILAGCKTLKEAKELEGNTQKPGVCSRLCPWLCKNWFEPNEVEQDEIDPPALIGGDESDFDSTSNTTVKDFKDEETQPLRWRTSRYDMIVTK